MTTTERKWTGREVALLFWLLVRSVNEIAALQTDTEAYLASRLLGISKVAACKLLFEESTCNSIEAYAGGLVAESIPQPESSDRYCRDLASTSPHQVTPEGKITFMAVTKDVDR